MNPPATALVPMKAHSERVAGKNLRPLAGRPLFHWIMDALTEAESIGRIVVNTDSEEIARQAETEFGATILWRPEHLLGDMVGIQPLIEWDIEHSEGDVFLQTHSTNPLLRAETIDRVVSAYFEDDGHDSVFTVTALQTRLYWPDGRPVNHDPDHMLRTQDLEPVLEENSCAYVFSRALFAERGHRLGANPRMLAIPALEAVDIDEPSDFEIAEALMHLRLGAES